MTMGQPDCIFGQFRETARCRDTGAGFVVLLKHRLIVYFFVCLFLCQQDYEKTGGPICMEFSGLIKFWSILANGSAGQRSICYYRI